MHRFRTRRLPFAALATIVLASAVVLATAGTAVAAAPPLTRVSADVFTNTTSQHRTEVEPDTYAFGSTIVAVAQAGRFFDGGASDNVWMTSRNSGTSWSSGTLPGITGVVGAVASFKQQHMGGV